jgi:ABC-type polysaccharide/polyol phosphate export permease
MVVQAQASHGGWQAIACRCELIWLLTRDALRRQFAGSLLGLWWACVKPVVMVGAYAFLVLAVFQPSERAGASASNYLLLLMSGMAPWLLLTEPLAAASTSLTANSSLLTKVLFPIEILPVSRMLAAATSGGMALLVLVGVLSYQGRLGLWLAVLPIVILIELLFVLGLGWLIAALTVTLPDVAHGLPFVLNLWMLLSPVLYSPEMVPSGWDWLARVNPMWSTIAVYRSLLLDSTFPDLAHLGGMVGWSIASFLFGYGVFMKRRKLFADLV